MTYAHVSDVELGLAMAQERSRCKGFAGGRWRLSGVAPRRALVIQPAGDGERGAVALLLHVVGSRAGALIPAVSVEALREAVGGNAVVHIGIVGAGPGVVVRALARAPRAQAEARPAGDELRVVGARSRILAAGARVVQLGGHGVGGRGRLRVARLGGVGAGARILVLGFALEPAGERVGGAFAGIARRVSARAGVVVFTTATPELRCERVAGRLLVRYGVLDAVRPWPGVVVVFIPHPVELHFRSTGRTRYN
jgi:hypothetical protein